MLPINVSLAHTSNYTKGRNQRVKYIVIHYTGNKGDTSLANCKYYQGENRSASAHYFVDENSIWQSVKDEDKAWHCGTTGKYYHPECRNSNSIGVEMCSDWSNGEYIITDRTVANAVSLVQFLMKKYGVDIDHIVRHYDVTHKLCPRPFVLHPEQWSAFKSKLEDNTVAVKTQTVEQTTYEYLNDVPEKFRPIIDKLMTAGIIQGDGSDATGNGDVINLTHEQVRILVFTYRGGAFDKKLVSAGLEPAV